MRASTRPSGIYFLVACLVVFATVSVGEAWSREDHDWPGEE